MSEYSEKLKDPRWQKMRLKVLERDEFTCKFCKSKEKTLHVHHLIYEWGKDPWEYKIDNFLTLCKLCHKDEKENRKYLESKVIDPFKSFPIDNMLHLSSAIDNFKNSESPHPCPSLVFWAAVMHEISIDKDFMGITILLFKRFAKQRIKMEREDNG